MTSRERVLAALEHKQTDRPPIYPVMTFVPFAKLLGKTVSDVLTNYELTYEILYRAWEEFGFDGFEIPTFGSTGKIKTVEENGILYTLDSDGNKDSYFPDRNSFPVPVRKAKVWEYDELLAMPLRSCDELLASGVFDLPGELIGRIAGRAFLSGHCAGQTFNSLVDFRGAENAFSDCFDSPELVHQAHSLFTRQTIEKAKAFAKIGADAIYIGDAWSSASVISPGMFEEFCLPYYRLAAEEIHRLGLKVYLHICGNSSPILELMADTGVDAIEPLDPLGGVSLADARNRVGRRVALKGGINTLTLLNGTPDEVEAETRACMEICKDLPGYLFGTGDDIPRDAPVENIRRMCDTVRAYN